MIFSASLWNTLFHDLFRFSTHPLLKSSCARYPVSCDGRCGGEKLFRCSERNSYHYKISKFLFPAPKRAV